MADVLIEDVGGGDGGGSTGGQPSVCTSISGYYINPGTGDILIKDYCPLFADCVVTQVPELRDGTGANQLELISYYADDIWTVDVSLPYYCGSSLTQLRGIRRGTKPQFNAALKTFSSSEFITITRTNNLLTFTGSLGASYTFGPSFFKDGVIPTCIFVTLQGGGGGGGSCAGPDEQYPGSGGGGGAFGQIILNLLKVNGYFRLIVGSGGIGRYKDSGTQGTASVVQWVESGTGIAYNIATAGGGYAGKRYGKQETGAGGTFYHDPYYLNNRYFYMVGNAPMRDGANGGGSGTAGSGLSALDLFATNNSNDHSGINKQTFPAKSGGFVYDRYRGGGGGASMSANGANGGTSAGGNSGSLGSGGSGGGDGAPNKGGNGGDGYISIYY